jgi:hypothetical protein
MGLYIDHVNTVLGKLRETPITSLSTSLDTEAYRAQEAVQRAVSRVWNLKNWGFKVRSTTLATVSGTVSYALPPYVGDIFTVRSTSDPYTLEMVTEQNVDKWDGEQTSTGQPEAVRMFDTVGCQVQPASAGVVVVSSSSASDTTQSVVVRGVQTTTGLEVYETLALAGTGSVAGSTSFEKVFAVTKSAATVGQVNCVIGATTIAVLAPQEKVFMRRIMKVYPIPNAAYTLTLKYYAAAPLLASAYDSTQIPVRWDYVVDQFAFALALQAKGKEQGEEFAAQIGLAQKMVEGDMAQDEAIEHTREFILGSPTDAPGAGWINRTPGYYPVQGW